ncbi:MAG: M20/M25/M40 family metallo-hydrolase, partial [Acidobacteriota bacterium]
ADTRLAIDGKPVAADAFVPQPYSATKTVEAPLARAGWGTTEADYKAVKGKIAVVHRFAPPEVKDAAENARLSDIRYKAFLARGKGAVGVIVVDDGDPKAEEAPLPELAPRSGEPDPTSIGQAGDVGIPVVVAKRAAVTDKARRAKLGVALLPKRTPTDNVIGVLRAGAATRQATAIVIGAHLDHLGMGGGSNALDPKVHAPHGGADDNASGVAALLEVARILGAHKQDLQRDVYLVAFSGEEEGDLGSTYFVTHSPPKTLAMINMDMVGRMRGDQLSVNGAASAKEWKELVEPICRDERVQCTIGGSGYGPSDHMAFYVEGIPVLYFFTGNHLEYHTANDKADKINAAGGAKVAEIATKVALALEPVPQLTYVKTPPEGGGGDVRHIGASLGTVPSYSDDPNQPPGMALSDVVPDGPAAKAGLKGGDRIVKIGAVDIRNVHDLMFVLQAAKPGETVDVTYVRDGKHETVKATYGVPRGRR